MERGASLSDLDLGITVAGIEFRSPMVAASSECTADTEMVRRLCEGPVGAIVTKTFTSNALHKIRVRPYQFPLSFLGKGFSDGHALYSLAAPHVEDLKAWSQKVSVMAKACRAASVVLIASFFEDPGEHVSWAETARALEGAGASLLELNFSCPHVSRTFEQGFDSALETLERVRRAVRIPVGVKIGPSLEPLEQAVAALETAAPDFITAHNAPGGLVVDVDREVPFGAPAIGGYAPGRAFLPISLARVVRIRRVSAIPVIGVGGVSNHRDALQYLLVGCPLVGVASALYFEGAEIMGRLHKGLVSWMRRKGYRRTTYSVPPEGPYVPVVDRETCISCGTCVRGCIYGALRLGEGGCVEADGDLCWSCGFCVGVCPSGAMVLCDRGDPTRVVWDNRGSARTFRRAVQERDA